MKFKQKTLNTIQKSELLLQGEFQEIDEVAFFNQEKVLTAFRNQQVAIRHFTPTTGYGYSDGGRETICKIYAEVFGSDDCIVSPLIASGTHALTTALFGVLRPGDRVLSITGAPYDTLQDAISGKVPGSFREYQIEFDLVDLKNDDFDFVEIQKKLADQKYKMVFRLPFPAS